jgi:hypothetical protein
MGIFSRLHESCFCAFCKAERRVYSKKHIGLTNVLAAMLLSSGITFVFWGELDPRGLMLFCLTMVGSEVFIFFRWRSSLVCRLCGFDPVIYKRSPERAAARVREFYEKASQNPNFQLSRSPLVERQKQQRQIEKQKYEMALLEARLTAKSRGQNVSQLSPGKSL